MSARLIFIACAFLLCISITAAESNIGVIPAELTCHCGGNFLNPNCNGSNTCTVVEGVCHRVIEERESGIHETLGCYTREDLDYSPFLCAKLYNVPNLNIFCCGDSDYCNGESITLPPEKTSEKPSFSSVHQAVIIASCAGVLIISMVIIFILLVRRKRSRVPFFDRTDTDSSMSFKDYSESDGKDSVDVDWSTGSGAGLPLLVQRTIARQVQIQEVIGKGRYGEVYRGKWLGDVNVAVKKFSSRDESSFFRECQIYQTIMLRHENILGFIAADNKDGGTWTELWLLSDYHENGSLFDYLGQHQVDKPGLFKLAASIASGLAHLHMEIVGVQGRGKPPIAHRDLKSKNILVKNNGECAIADLGLAVRHDSATDTIDIPLNNRVGTVRYMAPEVLSETLNMRHFDSFKRADIYSLGLVLWEITRRCNIGGQSLSYELPYFDVVPSDPSIDDMKAVVSDKKIRPTCTSLWMQNDCLSGLYKIMCECWYENGSARLTALRVRKALIHLQQEEGVKIV